MERAAALLALALLTVLFVNLARFTSSVNVVVEELQFDYIRSFYVKQEIKTLPGDPWAAFGNLSHAFVGAYTSNDLACTTFDGRRLETELPNAAVSTSFINDVDPDVASYYLTITFFNTTYRSYYVLRVVCGSVIRVVWTVNNTGWVDGRTYQYRLSARPASVSTENATITVNAFVRWMYPLSFPTGQYLSYSVSAFSGNTSVSISPSISGSASVLSSSTVRGVLQLTFPSADAGKTIDRLFINASWYGHTQRIVKIVWNTPYTIQAGDVLTIQVDLVLVEP